MQIGNITQDDLYQLVSMFLCLVSTGIWLYVMRHSSTPLFFIPPLMASLVTLAFYIVVVFIPMSIATATTLSAARTMTDLIMWILSGAAMIFIMRHRVRV